MNTKERKRIYERQFANIQYRAFRAMEMNYNEAHLYDKWAHRAERFAAGASCVAAVLGAFFYQQIPGFWNLFRSSEAKWQLFWLFIVLACIAVLFFIGGFSKLFRSYAKRAQNHVNAGAEWTRISRLAELYRCDLIGMQPDDVIWPDQERLYKELLDLYVKASTFTVIRESAYKQFSDVKVVLEKYDEREFHLDNFLCHERNRHKTHMA